MNDLVTLSNHYNPEIQQLTLVAVHGSLFLTSTLLELVLNTDVD